MRFSNETLLIFDLGGVIIDLNYDRMYRHFEMHTDKSLAEIKSVLSQDPILLKYEIGEIDSKTFYDALSNILEFRGSFDHFSNAWNSLMEPLQLKKIELLHELSFETRVTVLSNTNDLHQKAFDQQVREVSDFTSMANVIHTAYYSHVMGARKPDAIIFQRVCEMENINPSNCVFFDDNLENIKTASNLEISTFHITYQDQIFDLLDAEKIR